MLLDYDDWFESVGFELLEELEELEDISDVYIEEELMLAYEGYISEYEDRCYDEYRDSLLFEE